MKDYKSVVSYDPTRKKFSLETKFGYFVMAGMLAQFGLGLLFQKFKKFAKVRFYILLNVDIIFLCL